MRFNVWLPRYVGHGEPLGEPADVIAGLLPVVAAAAADAGGAAPAAGGLVPLDGQGDAVAVSIGPGAVADLDHGQVVVVVVAGRLGADDAAVVVAVDGPAMGSTVLGAQERDHGPARLGQQPRVIGSGPLVPPGLALLAPDLWKSDRVHQFHQS